METLFLESGQVLHKLTHLINSAGIDEIDFAIAYLSNGGYSCIEESIERFLSRKGCVRFLVGLSKTFITESSALRRLLALAKNTKDNKFEVKYHNLEEAEFHPKLFAAKSKGNLKAAIIGSSNLTIGGQTSNVEANVLVEISNSSYDGAHKFELDVKNFFEYLWAAGNSLDSGIIKEYTVGEKIRKRTKAKITSKVTPTSLPSFIYLNGKRTNAHSLEVLCTSCQSYVKVPINDFCCNECGEDPEIDTPSPNDSEQLIISKQKGIKVKIDGKELFAEAIDIRCPDCKVPIGLTNDFMLWIICKECANAKKQNGTAFCRPFEKWDNKATKNLYYSIPESRIKIKSKANVRSKRLEKSGMQVLTYTPFKYRVLPSKEKTEIKTLLGKIGRNEWYINEVWIRIAKKHHCSAWQIVALKAVVTRQNLVKKLR